MIKLNSTCKGRSNAKRLKIKKSKRGEEKKAKKNSSKSDSGCKQHFVLPIWMFLCLRFDKSLSPFSYNFALLSMHDLHTF